jgi:hypothetical protein
MEQELVEAIRAAPLKLAKAIRATQLLSERLCKLAISEMSER